MSIAAECVTASAAAVTAVVMQSVTKNAVKWPTDLICSASRQREPICNQFERERNGQRRDKVVCARARFRPNDANYVGANALNIAL